MSRDSYHHGDLKAVILAQAADLVAQRGADGISLRELAREAGVSHAAPAHHFTDRRGLFTALAAEGWRLLADALKGARRRFRRGGAGLRAVRARASRALRRDVRPIARRSREPGAGRGAGCGRCGTDSGVGTLDDARAENDPEGAALAAWSLVHGFSLLWLNGNIPAIGVDGDPMETVHRVAGMLFKTR